MMGTGKQKEGRERQGRTREMMFRAEASSRATTQGPGFPKAAALNSADPSTAETRDCIHTAQ